MSNFTLQTTALKAIQDRLLHISRMVPDELDLVGPEYRGISYNNGNVTLHTYSRAHTHGSGFNEYEIEEESFTITIPFAELNEPDSFFTEKFAKMAQAKEEEERQREERYQQEQKIQQLRIDEQQRLQYEELKKKFEGQ